LVTAASRTVKLVKWSKRWTYLLGLGARSLSVLCLSPPVDVLLSGVVHGPTQGTQTECAHASRIRSVCDTLGWILTTRRSGAAPPCRNARDESLRGAREASRRRGRDSSAARYRDHAVTQRGRRYAASRGIADADVMPDPPAAAAHPGRGLWDRPLRAQSSAPARHDGSRTLMVQPTPQWGSEQVTPNDGGLFPAPRRPDTRRCQVHGRHHTHFSPHLLTTASHN
jgi:hypothetical protein